MRNADYGRRVTGIVVSVFSCLSVLGLSCTPATARDLRLEHVTIVSPERASPMRDAILHIRDARIISISTRSSPAAPVSTPDVEVIDGKGLYLAPGLIDSHVHLGDVPGMTAPQEQAHPELARAARAQIPRSYLYFGFTTLVDLNSSPEHVAEWSAHAVHPDLYFCGAAPVMDGYPMNFTPKPLRYRQSPYMLIERGHESMAPDGIGPAEHTPEAVVARMKADGASCVKSHFERGFSGQRDLPVPRLDTIRALVRAAHTAGMPVFFHANSTEAQQFALDAGVDIIVHGLWNWNGARSQTELPSAVKQTLDRIVAANVGLHPTMQVLYGERDLFDPAYLSDPRLMRVLPANLIAWYRSAAGQWFHDILAASHLSGPGAESSAAAQWEIIRSNYAAPIERSKVTARYLVENDARILFGTDTPSSPTYANPPGLNGWVEMHRLVAAGMTPAQVFRAATLANAEALGLSRELGTVEPGKRANLLLLRKDPSRTIEAYDEIVTVILHGRAFDRATLAAD